MFNHTHHHHTTVRQEVTEKRAPTDESVRLLREMESAAREQVQKSMSLPGNELKGVIHTRRDMLDRCLHVGVSFRLNNELHEVRVALNDYECQTKDSRIEKIIDAVSKDIALTVLRQAWTTDVMREMFA